MTPSHGLQRTAPGVAELGVVRKERKHSADMKRLAIIVTLTAACFLSGCLGISDAVRQSIEASRAVPEGTLVQMPLFAAHAPDDGLAVFRDSPRRGYLSFRYPFRALGSYNVFPFTLDREPPNLKSAWMTFIEQSGQPSYLQRMKAVTDRQIVWRGQPAWYHELSFSGSFNESGFVLVGMVVQRGSHYFHINRSVPSSGPPDLIAGTLDRARKDYNTFAEGLTLK